MLTRVLAWLAAVLALAAAAPGQAAQTAQKEPRIQVGILLFEGVQIIDFTGPYEVFGAAGFGVGTVSKDGKPLTTAMGMKVTPDHAFATAPAFDVLLVPGGDEDEAARDPEVQRFVRERGDAARNVLSVCTGSFILASSGVLDGLRATTFHRRLRGLEHRFPKVNVVRDVRWADNGKVITAAGLSSGIDAALHVVARLRGTDAARSTALHLEYDWNPDGGFVRTRMADRYMPTFGKPGADWPKDLKTEQLSAFGDAMRWRARVRLTTVATPAAMLQAIATAVEAEGGWQRAAGTAANTWQREAEGKRVRFSVTPPAGHAAGPAYELELTVELL